MAKPISPELLCRRWVHSHEEDSAGATVFRPAEFSFPPSRGRKSIELRADGTLRDFAIGATDRSVARDGQWTLNDDGQLALDVEGALPPSRTLRIVSIDQDRLVVRK